MHAAAPHHHPPPPLHPAGPPPPRPPPCHLLARLPLPAPLRPARAPRLCHDRAPVQPALPVHAEVPHHVALARVHRVGVLRRRPHLGQVLARLALPGLLRTARSHERGE